MRDIHIPKIISVGTIIHILLSNVNHGYLIYLILIKINCFFVLPFLISN